MAATKKKDQWSVCSGNLHMATVVFAVLFFFGKVDAVDGCPEAGQVSGHCKY